MRHRFHQVGGGEVRSVEDGSHVEASFFEYRLDGIALGEVHLRLHTAFVPGGHTIHRVVNEQVIETRRWQVVIQIEIHLAVAHFRGRHHLIVSFGVGQEEVMVAFETHPT